MKVLFHLLSLWLFVFLFASLSKGKNTDIISFNANKSSIIRNTVNSLDIASFAKYQSKYLGPNNGPVVLIKKQVGHEMQCIADCVADFKCISINLAKLPNSDGKFPCELLKTDKFDTNTASLTDNVNFNHLSIWSKCMSTPCNQNEACVPLYANQSYTCQQ
ncbi:uncharacterized protein LOC110232298 [Exaiptasia diaphana]|uniref:Apple domain-containing protein n=1 Tax=Exaiptasia diaphana TaxID=2652724 RepID=A0A913WRS8_EXADI|nr:uncharacterized protein LOC110232298 [Exaiptasia diaphana]KXJ28051.1 hypothetical protein AC249_AIPGENE21773 [Exaiptasia diaphana]